MTAEVYDLLTLLIDVATLGAVCLGAVVGIIKLNGYHRETNSKMDAYIALVKKSSFAEGAKTQKEINDVRGETNGHI